MAIDELESKIKSFVEIAEKLPERYREKCFEVMLTNYLSTLTTAKRPEITVTPPPTPTAKPIIPIDVKAFLQQYSIPEDSIQKLFFVEGQEIRPIYNLKTTKKSDAQMQVASLIAFEHALKEGKFEFSMQEVRQKCKELKVYDMSNFTAHFKNNTKLFKDLTDEEHIELSTDGKDQLSEVIMEITK
jgi:hypothetical protein